MPRQKSSHRGHGEGTITLRKDGRYAVGITLRGEGQAVGKAEELTELVYSLLQ